MGCDSFCTECYQLDVFCPKVSKLPEVLHAGWNSTFNLHDPSEEMRSGVSVTLRCICSHLVCRERSLTSSGALLWPGSSSRSRPSALLCLSGTMQLLYMIQIACYQFSGFLVWRLKPKFIANLKPDELIYIIFHHFAARDEGAHIWRKYILGKWG